MELTEKEKSRRYRERLKDNPEKLAERRRKKRESYHKNKTLISDLKLQEKVNCRICIACNCRQEQRKRKKVLEDINVDIPSVSPMILQEPVSPLLGQPPPSSPVAIISSTNKTRGRKNVRRDRSHLYKENQRLKAENEKLKRKYEKYKKRAQLNNRRS